MTVNVSAGLIGANGTDGSRKCVGCGEWGCIYVGTASNSAHETGEIGAID